MFIADNLVSLQPGKDAAQQPAERCGILGGERQRLGSQPGFHPEGAGNGRQVEKCL